MTVKIIKEYLAPSSATPKGHMKTPRTGIKSRTKQQQQHEKIREDPVVDMKIRQIYTMQSRRRDM